MRISRSWTVPVKGKINNSQDAVRAMMPIEKSAGEVGNIISLIDVIAFQTNLLP